ncbi:electron transfer flavoprotein subunit beta/FixA family protein [Chrysiogenes arsenatis]|uniref:electron transfer flavoprotein subunit beta/FixA family protein n=1 Tax=Chrysiogenes arsenatis TaxID=309797 RepID=UPI00040DF2F2|nr:electron transfer flavoprotein subunit beta/FixA family protein [Chrysiogenes arsenatis]
MKILVCMKQVPDLESRFRVNADGTWFDESDLAFRMNEYDEYAVEQAVQVREKLGAEAELTVLSVGPARVVEALKKALAMGCDKAVHILDAAVHTKDPAQIAATIAQFCKDKDFKLIFTGMQSQDRGSAQVGVLLASALGYSCATTIVDFSLVGDNVEVKRELEGGTKGVVTLSLPAVFTCQLGLNSPRYPTLPNIMKAKKKEIREIPVAELTCIEPLALTRKVYPPEKKSGGLVLEGDVATMVDRVVSLLKEKTSVLR